MKFEVHIDDISREQWEQHARMFNDYSIYQTWPYQQVRAEMDRQNISRAIVTDELGNPVTMCQMRIKHVRVLCLKIGYVQCGPLLRRKDNADCPVEALQMLRDAYVGHRVNILRFVPNVWDNEAGKLICQTLVQSGFRRCVNYNPYRSLVLSVDNSHEQIRAGLHKSFRRDLKKAEGLGLELRQGTGDEFCRVLEDLYLASIKRKGFKGLNPEEFTKTQVLLSPGEKLSFFMASQDGEPVTIFLTSVLGDTSLVLLAAANEKGLAIGASYILWYQGALAANDAGMKIYDLGGIDPVNNHKVFQFKSRIGGLDMSYIGAFESSTNPMVNRVWRIAESIYRFVEKK